MTYGKCLPVFLSLAVTHRCNLLAEYFAIEKDQGAQRLILSRGGDLLLDRQVVEKLLNVLLIHLGRMAFVMKEDVALDPIDVGLLSANAVVLAANRLPDLIQKSGFV